jgi:hypothetical protein
MAMANLHTQMELIMKEILRMIKCKVKAHYSMAQIDLHMKEVGCQINSMALVFSTTKIHYS